MCTSEVATFHNGKAAERFGIGLGGDFTVEQQNSAGADVQRFGNMMIGENHADPFLREIAEQGSKAGSERRIDARERLVANENFRGGGDGAREFAGHSA